MNFDQVYEKYLNGTATEEEKAYVEAEIAKAKKLSEIIDSLEAKRVIESADTEKVKAATRTMKKKFGLRAALISLLVLVILGLSITVSILGYVNLKAHNAAEYDKQECFELAKKCVNDHGDVLSTDLAVVEWDRDLRIVNGKLSKAIYVYEIEVRKGTVEYEVEVNSRTGEAVIVDVDR
ncbi:MAG: hypothetical protein E7599_06810 [Ruminococcaceae bacterium]|nr:hypothetical protein [Oscillospiraceae bacterium]